MSCIRIEDLAGPSEPDPPRQIAAIPLVAGREVFAAAAALTACLAGSDLVIARSGSSLVDPARSIRELLEAAEVPIAAELSQIDLARTLEVLGAGARRVVYTDGATADPKTISTVLTRVGREHCLFQIDCDALSPERIELTDADGRSLGVDCRQLLSRLETAGAARVILRPGRSMPSELLLPLIEDSGLSIHIERPGWSLALADALGADGLVAEGALGCRELLEWRCREPALA